MSSGPLSAGLRGFHSLGRGRDSASACSLSSLLLSEVHVVPAKKYPVQCLVACRFDRMKVKKKNIFTGGPHPPYLEEKSNLNP